MLVAVAAKQEFAITKRNVSEWIKKYIADKCFFAYKMCWMALRCYLLQTKKVFLSYKTEEKYIIELKVVWEHAINNFVSFFFLFCISTFTDKIVFFFLKRVVQNAVWETF